MGRGGFKLGPPDSGHAVNALVVIEILSIWTICSLRNHMDKLKTASFLILGKHQF